MLRSEAISIIKAGTGFRVNQDATIIRALQTAQRDLEQGKSLPNFLIEFDATIDVTANNDTITLPTNFLRLHDDYDLYYVNSGSARVFLPRRNYTEAYQAYVASGEEDDSVVTSNSEYPKVVVYRNQTTAILIPTPTVSFTAKLTYYKKAAVLNSDAENEWLANSANYLIGMAGIHVAGPLRDKDAMAYFTTMLKSGAASHMGQIVDDELMGRGLVMGRDN